MASEPSSEHISIRKIDNGYMVSHSKSHEGKDGSMGKHESKEVFMAKRPNLDVGSMKDGSREVKRVTSGGKSHPMLPKKTPLNMGSDKAGEHRALDEKKRTLPSGRPDKALKKAADTGGPAKAPEAKRGEKVRGGKESMGDFVKRRERETKRKK